MDSYEIHDLAANATVKTMDVRPIIVNDRALLPIRFVANALGAEVDWTSATAESPLIVHLTIHGETLSFGIGEMTPELTALGMDVPAQIINNRTMVPLRFISEFFGAVVTWDNEAHAAEITFIPNGSPAQQEENGYANGDSPAIAIKPEDEEENGESENG
jgi:hypothetical protein